MLVEILNRGARAYGYDNELWTLTRIAWVIEAQLGVQYHHRLGYLKSKLLPNLCPKNLDELVDHTRRALRKIQRLPKVLASFFAAAGLENECSGASTELCEAW